MLYIVPNLKKIAGGPTTRISSFKDIFKHNRSEIVEGNSVKLKKSIGLKKIKLCYIETATNRLGLVDVVSLSLLRFRASKRIVFIRDIYIELFPEEYKSFRGRVTRLFNKLSNYYLTLFATTLVFPTKEMGRVFFEKNPFYPKRPYTELPPGTYNITQNKQLPDSSKKLGILYLGSTNYTNAGFDNFLEFEKKYRDHYNFFVLTGDKEIQTKIKCTSIISSKVKRDNIPAFIEKHNIAYAFHTRPRNTYDDLTFPIKVFDFLSFQLPFFSEKHVPLTNLLGNDYPLFASYDQMDSIHQKIQQIDVVLYQKLVGELRQVAEKNTYEKRYQKILGQHNPTH